MFVMRLNHDTAMIWVYALRYELTQEKDSTFAVDYICPSIAQLDTDILHMMLKDVSLAVKKEDKRLAVWKKFGGLLRQEIFRRAGEETA